MNRIFKICAAPKLWGSRLFFIHILYFLEKYEGPSVPIVTTDLLGLVPRKTKEEFEEEVDDQPAIAAVTGARRTKSSGGGGDLSEGCAVGRRGGRAGPPLLVNPSGLSVTVDTDRAEVSGKEFKGRTWGQSRNFWELVKPPSENGQELEGSVVRANPTADPDTVLTSMDSRQQLVKPSPLRAPPRTVDTAATAARINAPLLPVLGVTCSQFKVQGRSV